MWYKTYTSRRQTFMKIVIKLITFSEKNSVICNQKFLKGKFCALKLIYVQYNTINARPRPQLEAES